MRLKRAGPTWLELGVGFTRSAPSTVCESLHVECLLTCEHVVDGPAQLVGQDADGLGLAVLAAEPFHYLVNDLQELIFSGPSSVF